jgi:hypothetical protein
MLRYFLIANKNVAWGECKFSDGNMEHHYGGVPLLMRNSALSLIRKYGALSFSIL